MTDREKLLNLIQKAKDECASDYSDHTENEYITDTLLDNGVTFATGTKVGDKWISVEDRLPIECEDVLVYIDDPDMAKGEEYTPNNIGFIENGAWYYSHELFEHGTYAEIPCITHWMPLPEPPKEDDYDLS